MAINSKQKGSRGERMLAEKFREYGYDEARRTQQYAGFTGDASDITGIPYIHPECKFVEKLNIHEAMSQAVRDSAKAGNIPVVFHKKSRTDWLVTMRFDDWIKLYKEYEDGRN